MEQKSFFVTIGDSAGGELDEERLAVGGGDRRVRIVERRWVAV